MRDREGMEGSGWRWLGGRAIVDRLVRWLRGMERYLEVVCTGRSGLRLGLKAITK